MTDRVQKHLNQQALMYLLNTENVCLSEKVFIATLCSHRLDCDSTNHPRTVGQLFGCLYFLQQVPDARAELPRLARLSPYWDAIITHWNSLESTLLDDLGTTPKNNSEKLLQHVLEMGKIYEA